MLNKFLCLKILVLTGLCVCLCGCWTTQQGEKIGTVVKIAKEGLWFKTWEVEIIKGGMSNGSGGFGVKPFDATVSNQKILAVLQNAINNQQEVKITYHVEAFTWPTRNESHEGENRFIDSVEILK